VEFIALIDNAAPTMDDFLLVVSVRERMKVPHGELLFSYLHRPKENQENRQYGAAGVLSGADGMYPHTSPVRQSRLPHPYLYRL
jgi:hypothetical protein